jgi:osmoprotectant transport system substrate-binding protein
VAFLLVLCASLASGGCGGESVDKSAVTLPIRSEGSPEMRLLAQIYGQALRITGYNVKKASPKNRLLEVMEELESRKIAGYPQHLSTTLFADFLVAVERLPADSQVAYELAKENLEKKGLTAFPPTPFGIANVVAMLKETAEEHGLKTDSDLKGEAEHMTLKAPTYCHVSLDCLGGIEWHYDTAFEVVSYERGGAADLAWTRPEPAYLYEVLEDGEVDASMVFNTDGRLAEKEKFVVLEDDKHAFPAGNVVWVTSQQVAEEAGPDYEKAIVEAQEGLTVGVMRELNARMELGGEAPAEVAAEYLKSIDYKG